MTYTYLNISWELEDSIQGEAVPQILNTYTILQFQIRSTVRVLISCWHLTHENAKMWKFSARLSRTEGFGPANAVPLKVTDLRANYSSWLQRCNVKQLLVVSQKHERKDRYHLVRLYLLGSLYEKRPKTFANMGQKQSQENYLNVIFLPFILF